MFALSIMLCCVLMPVHMTQPDIAIDVLRRTLRWDHRIPLALWSDHLRLYSGIILVKLTVPLGIASAAALIYAAFTWLFLEIIRMAGPTFFAQFNYLAVMAGLAWGWIIFAEPVHSAVWLALVLMVAGILLLSLTSQPPASTDAQKSGGM